MRLYGVSFCFNLVLVFSYSRVFIVGINIPSVIKVVSREPLAVTDTVVAIVAVEDGAVPSKMEVTEVVGTASLRMLVGIGATLVVDTAIGA